MREIYFVPYGGLGNQLFQFACALALADGGKIHVLSDWGFARRNSTNQIELCDLVLGTQTTFEQGSISIGPMRLLNFLLRLGAKGDARSTLSRFGCFCISLFSSIKLGKILKVKVGEDLAHLKVGENGNLLLLGYFQSYKWAKGVIDELLKIQTKSLSSKASALVARLQSKDVLIVHVRRGDYKDEDFGILDDNYYKNALGKHKERKFDEIWVFSDEGNLAREIPCLREDSRVVFVDDSELSSCEILDIMRGGAGYIIANSSFSWWAATLRAKRDALVVAPYPWFKAKNTPNEIIDPNWISIPW